MAHPLVEILFEIIAYLDACLMFSFILQSLAFFHNINDTLYGINVKNKLDNPPFEPNSYPKRKSEYQGKYS